MPDISIVIPVFNEEECLPNFHRDLSKFLDSFEKSSEIIFIDDGSNDRSGEVLSEICDKDERVVLIRFRRNFGQTAALSAGFDHARGEIIISMDGDGQNDPADIPALLEKMEEGYDVVSGWRKDRKDSLLWRTLPSWMGNRLISLLTGISLRDFGCTLKAYKKEILDEISIYGEMHRMIPVLAYHMGANIAEVPVRHHKRKHGRSKYNLSRAFSVVLDLITLKFFLGYFTRPLHIFGLIGLCSFLLGIGSFAAMIAMKITEGIDMTGNPFMILGVLLFIIGGQLVMLGLLGEVNIRTYFESQDKPVYVVKEIRGQNR